MPNKKPLRKVVFIIILWLRKGGMEIFPCCTTPLFLGFVSRLTQEKFAEHTDMSYKFYQHIEAGMKKLIRIDTIERLAQAYDMPLHGFFAPYPPKSISVKVLKRSKPHSRK